MALPSKISDTARDNTFMPEEFRHESERFAAGDLLLTWHWWHSLTISAMSPSIPGHHAMPWASAFILHTPGWPWCSSSNTVVVPSSCILLDDPDVALLTLLLAETEGWSLYCPREHSHPPHSVHPAADGWTQFLFTGVASAMEHHLPYGDSRGSHAVKSLICLAYISSWSVSIRSTVSPGGGTSVGSSGSGRWLRTFAFALLTLGL